MRYWGLLGAKLAAAGSALFLLWRAWAAWWPEPEPVLRVRLSPFGRDLAYTTAVMVYWLLCVGVLYLIALDQRYRCRTCGRRLRMPITTGTWQHVLLGAPRTDYICPYGHGTLRVPQVHLAGPEEPDWEPIDDMWKELESTEGNHR